jgi:two-component system chemotaxis sensor kinase CheA
MTNADQPLPDFLRRLRLELDQANVEDATTLNRPRASLEWLAMTRLPDRLDARRLSALAAEGIAMLDGGDAPPAETARRILGAVKAAFSAVSEHLDKPDDFGRELLLIQAGQQLLSTMGRDPADWLRGAAASSDAAGSQEDDALSLDDAAALLLMVEPSEREEMERIRATLSTIAADETAVEMVRTMAREAQTSIERVLSCVDEGTDATAVLAEVANFVEAAVRARDEAEDVKARAPRTPTPIRGSVVIPPPAAGVAPTAPAPVAVDELPDGDHELIADFLVECRDYLESAEGALLELEANPTDLEAINTVFRAFHTVKGTSGFLGLDVITDFAHEAESLFSRVRDRELPFAGRVPDLALQATDVVKALLVSVEKALEGHKMVRPADYAAVLADLARVAVAEPGSPELLATSPAAKKPDIAPAAAADAAMSALVEQAAATVIDIKRNEVVRDERSASADSSIRVRTDRLDRLIDMIGELVIAQTMIAQDGNVQSAGHHGLSRKVSHAGKIVRELHDLSLSMRMVPLKPTFQKMTRLVRDVSMSIGKQVQFVTEGEETEIDRNMVDALSDPLVHMVRNAVDHGIETPDKRVAAGKPRHGTVRLSATHSGGTVVVELKDDGNGLDKDRIVQKAISKGLIESGAKMTESEIFNLIFAPGFSTAEKLTDVSGRGVGMDVVRRNIESLRGRIEITSTLGEGTTFTVRLPLTLAVTDGMLVQVGAERYILPTTSIFKSFRPERGALTTIAGRGEMVRLRDEVMPMFRLHRLFNVAGAKQDPCDALVVVVAVGDQRIGLVVDELLGQQQVVAKSLGDGIGKIQGVSGGAILGDGRVGLILDVGELLTLLRLGEPDKEPLRSVA